MDNFSFDDNLHQQTLFIVDEASMIANDGLLGAAEQDVFWTTLSNMAAQASPMPIGDGWHAFSVGEEQRAFSDVERGLWEVYVT